MRARPGVYWDERNYQRECVILEVQSPRDTRRLDALDARTGARILDPASAIPEQRRQE